MHNLIRTIAALARLVLVLLIVWQGARLVFRADLRDDLRRADALFAAGHYYAARASYAEILARTPRDAPALLRLGVVYAVRDERANATTTLAYAIGAGLDQRDLDLARLYQGRMAATAGERDQATRFWSMIGERSPLFSIGRVLEAENLLALADYAGAEAAYRAALLPDLPPDWRALVATRLAMLRASSDAMAAQAELAISSTHTALLADADFIAPLLPSANPSALLLGEVLRAAPDQRAQLLGQLYLQAGLYALAEAQFAAVAPDSANAVSAAAYAAYTRWSAGDHAEGLRRLQELVAAHPAEPRVHALLALAYLATSDKANAQAQLELLRALAPRAPDTHLAWGQWYTVQHDYAAAAAEYRRALSDAPTQQRGVYALALARFQLDSAYRVCEDGRADAEQATSELPDDPQAWVTLAAARFSCGDPAGTRAAAEQALQRSPSSAEASYYLGRALAALGDRAGARLALINAADFAPASPWRERAETQIAMLGL